MQEKRILFVDDEFSPDTDAYFGSYMSLYEEWLIDAGFHVQRATNVDDAIAFCHERQFDLSILDVMMPPGDALKDEDTKKGFLTGILLARRIRSIKRDLPIFLLSNAGEHQDLFTNVLEENIVEQVLFKLDVSPEDLVKLVVSFLI